MDEWLDGTKGRLELLLCRYCEMHLVAAAGWAVGSSGSTPHN
jgi:hypothetical protein